MYVLMLLFVLVNQGCSLDCNYLNLDHAEVWPLDSNEFYPNPDGPIANHTGSNTIVVTYNVKGGKRSVKIMRYLNKTWVYCQ